MKPPDEPQAELPAWFDLRGLLKVLGVHMKRLDLQRLLDDYGVKPVRNERPKSKKLYPVSEMPAWMIQSIIDVQHYRAALERAGARIEVADVTAFLQWRAKQKGA